VGADPTADEADEHEVNDGGTKNSSSKSCGSVSESVDGGMASRREVSLNGEGFGEMGGGNPPLDPS